MATDGEQLSTAPSNNTNKDDVEGEPVGVVNKEDKNTTKVETKGSGEGGELSEGSNKGTRGHRSYKAGKYRHRRRVYYSSSSSSSEDDDYSSRRYRRSKQPVKGDYTRTSYNYSHLRTSMFPPIAHSKSPYFDGNNYQKWRVSMEYHLRTAHQSLWSFVKLGGEIPDGTEEFLTPEIEQAAYFNDHAMSILYKSLCDEEFAKVDGINNAHEVWMSIKIGHEGTKHIKKAKIELLEGELGRFTIGDDESPSEMYTRAKALINKIRNLGSKKWTEREFSKLLLRAFAPRNITLVTMIRENPNFKYMTPQEVLGRIANHETFQVAARHAVELTRAMKGEASKPNIALKASKKSKEVAEESSHEGASDSSVDDEEMALFIKKFKRFMRRDHKTYDDKKDFKKSRSKRQCYKCGDHDHLIADCPLLKNKGKDKEEKKYHKDKKKHYKKRYTGEAHIGKEWVSDDSDSSSSEDEGNIATFAFNKSSLFPKDKHTCLMAIGGKRKVKTSHSPKYTTSDDDDHDKSSSSSEHAYSSHDDEVDFKSLHMFRGIDKNAMAKMEELMDELLEKEKLLVKKEEQLTLEKEKSLKLEKIVAQEKEKYESLDMELSKSVEANNSLKSANVALQEKLDQANKLLEEQFDTFLSSTTSPILETSTSNSTMALTCEKCKHIDLDAIACHESTIANLKMHVRS